MPIGHEAPCRGKRIYAHVVTKVLATELRADAHLLRQLVNLLLPLQISERATEFSFRGVQIVVIPGTRHLDGLQVLFRAQASYDDRQVVRRTRARADGFDVVL